MKLNKRYYIYCILVISCYGFSQDSTLTKTSLIENQTTEKGIASFYAKKFNGRKTTSGEIFQNDRLTAAHKTLKLGTYVKVRNVKNDSTVIVKVNDRLPKKSKRSIDLSFKAAKQLNFINAGLAKVEITVLDSLKK